MKRLLAALIVFGVLAAPAQAKPWVPQLHVGARGQKVMDLKWLLQGNDPSVYKSTIHPYHAKHITPYFGPVLAAAVRDAKWRLGYPAAQVNSRAGEVLHQVLVGKRRRPLEWIGRASYRLKHVPEQATVSATTVCARRLITIARAEIGVTEHPWGSNWGVRVAQYQSATGAYHAAWCASFAQWVLRQSGYGTIANRSASVGYIRQWGYNRGLLHAQARPGALALYGTEHTGIVTDVYRTYFNAVEGNYSNGVHGVTHPVGYRYTTFLWLPRCTG